MKTFFKNNKEKLLLILFCFILSFIVLLITSKNSYLYPLNDWVDANAFFTMGKGMAHGAIPYKDLFEQKGPLLFLIYMIGYLMSNTTFHGIFILEVISWTYTLYYAYKIITIFLSKKSAYLILPIFIVLCTTCKAFVHGGSAEEFTLPFMMLTLYYFISHFTKKELSYKEIAIAGFCAGCALVIKFTLLGFWFGFMASIFFHLIYKKNYKKAFIACVWFLVAMFTPLGISLIYFAINHGLKEFIQVYFITNITAYTVESSNIFSRLLLLLEGFIEAAFKNGILSFILLIGYIYFISKIKLKKEAKISLIAIYSFTILGIYFGLRFYPYYFYPIFIFSILSLISIFKFLEERYAKKFTKNYKYLIGGCLCICLICSYFGANYRKFMKVKKEDLFQYKFAEILKNDKDATLANMGFLDCGAYTASGIVPNVYYFHQNNLTYDKFPELFDSFLEYTQNKKTKYVIYFWEYKIDENGFITTTDKHLDQNKITELAKLEEIKTSIRANYDLVLYDEQKYENKLYYAYLYKAKSV